MNNENTIETDDSPQWAVVELMGHATMAGLISQEELFGGVMARLITPHAEDKSVVRYFNRANIYRLTLCDEATARLVIEHDYLPSCGYFDDDECVRLAQRNAPQSARPIASNASYDGEDCDDSDPFANE